MEHRRIQPLWGAASNENRRWHGRSAAFQSAVSQNRILRSASPIERTGVFRRPADFKSAIRQIENLRYAFGQPTSSVLFRRWAGDSEHPFISVKGATGQAAARVFVGISVGAGLKHAIQRLQEQLHGSCGKHAVRWVKPDQLHLTLKFFGNVGVDQFPELANALRGACQGVTAFRLAIGGLGCFPSLHRPSVIWSGVSGEVEILSRLKEGIDRATGAFGDHSETREFSPHLTIGRVKASGREARQVGLAVQNTQTGEIGSWDVAEVELIQSTLSPGGSTYRQLATVPFAVH